MKHAEARKTHDNGVRHDLLSYGNRAWLDNWVFGTGKLYQA